MNLKDPYFILEQIALVVASLVWTVIVLVGIAFFWAYQDIQTRWDYVLTAPPEALAQVAEVPPTIVLPVIESSPTPTPWAGPGPTATPTATKFPTPTATRVVPLPEVLPETLNPDDPVPVVVHTEEEVDELLQEEPAPAPVEIEVLATPTTAVDIPAPTSVPTLVPPTATPVPVVEEPAPVVEAPTGSGVPDHVTIPSVGIDAKIIPVGWNVVQKDGREYSIWQVADYAVGWHKTTALLGQPGNTVMAGHHNVNGEVFRDLVNVEVGDKVVIGSGGNTFEYVVEMKTIVKEKGESPEVRRKNAEWISPTNDERLTFVTCWPYTNNTHRVIVVARPT
ncbi:MAG: sortase [Anaerolineae bacterium]|nr:sortase [Anaerolineae bacterium]